MFESPDAIVAQLYLKNGDVVVDMGAGMGAFSVAAGKKVGKEGVVYAVEVQRQLLNIIAENAKHANVGNVRVIWGDVERDRGTKLASGIANVVIIANVLFQVEDKNMLVAEAARLLGKGGRIMVVEWKETAIGAGPKANQLVTTVSLDSVMAKVGLKRSETLNAGAHHYAIIYT